MRIPPKVRAVIMLLMGVASVALAGFTVADIVKGTAK